MHWLRMLFQNLKIDRERLLYDSIVLVWYFSKVKSDSIDIFQFGEQLLFKVSIFLKFTFFA